MSRGGATGLGEPLSEHRRRALARGYWSYLHRTEMPEAVDRIEYLVQAVSGRRIVHVGCSSEAETEGQFKAGTLLFARLEASASAQLGVDPDAEGMTRLEALVASRWPPQVCTLEAVPSELLERLRPELILLPEVIEHVPDPGQLLRAARGIALRYGAEVVITVPNALAMTAVSSWAGGEEMSHPDHVAVYTPRTLQSLLEKCGLSPIEIRPYTLGPPPAAVPALRKIWLFVRRGTGSVEQRIVALFKASLAGRFPDGWIGRAVAAAPTSHERT